MIKEIDSYQQLKQELIQFNKAYLLLYKKSSGLSDCAYNELLKTTKELNDVNLLVADVNRVKDIHSSYNISSVPTLIHFENNQLKNITKGCQSSGFYELLFRKNFSVSKPTNIQTVSKRVKVYSTPTCSWCNTLKRYLDEHGIRYENIDVSKDQKKADEMVKRSGQQGVPQTDINGTIIIGFDKNKIDQLLEIRK